MDVRAKGEDASATDAPASTASPQSSHARDAWLAFNDHHLPLYASSCTMRIWTINVSTTLYSDKGWSACPCMIQWTCTMASISALHSLYNAGCTRLVHMFTLSPPALFTYNES